MKQVHIIALHLSYGGIEKAVSNMANLFSHDYDVTIHSVYRIDEEPAYKINSNVKIEYLLSGKPNRAEFKNACKNRKLFDILRQGIKAVKILINKKKKVIRTIKKITDGVIITTRNEDNVLLSKFGSDEVTKIAQLHQDYSTDKRMAKCFAKKYRRIDYFTVLTPRLKEEIERIMYANKHTKVVCIPNFLDKFPENSTCERENSIIAVGRLDPVKGFDRLIRIFASFSVSHPDWRLKLVGDGAEETRLKKEAEDLNIKGSVDFCGRLGTEEIYSLMKSSKIYAMTSHSEALPFVLIEAFACGLPAVAFNVRVGPEAVITDGVNGYLVKNNDEEEYVEKLKTIADNFELNKTMGENAKESVSRFESYSVYKEWKSLLQN